MGSLNRSETAGTARALLLLLLFSLLSPAFAAGSSSDSNDVQVMQEFTKQEKEEGEAIDISDRKKHLILFIMGVTLLVLLVATAGFGIAMVVYGKQVFVAHMVLAAFSVTLAIAHSIVAIVWFFPFSGP